MILAVEEVMRHPNGGKLEVFVNVGERPGERVVKILPSLTGIQARRVVIQLDDGD